MIPNGKIHFPPELPIVAEKTNIIKAIQENQILIITGETGSGKTTQIPKMCLEAGRGEKGKIACSQPRRIAAVSLARQVAKELGCETGEKVGYKIRFMDKSSGSELIRFMTDGILLMEIRSDRLLRKYDSIIIDEAHERTLNIDFILGYLKRVLPRRPDLKLIVTSATIDVESFAEAFPQYYDPRLKTKLFYDAPRHRAGVEVENAPIIEVSGRLYPIEIRYSPIDTQLEEAGELSVVDLVQEAVEEIITETGEGDVLVFMAASREIRETAERLSYLEAENFLILPLFAALSHSEQIRIFAPSSKRKIIISTNIAETSITVPNIRYVADTGLARVSRYNSRSGVQGLPIEPVARSAADQRAGRCGRVRDGICVRLYDKEDFESRPLFATPEIQRSDLSEVILRMLSLKLGDIESFPFINPPESTRINAGFRTLRELGAIDKHNKLTSLGWQMSSLPVVPRVARMILQGVKENALYPVLIIAAAISCPDPREWPEDQKAQAAQKHARFVSKESDLTTLLNIWEFYHKTLDDLKTQSKMRKFCKQNFLSYRRIREWRDIRRQLSGIVKNKNWKMNKNGWDYASVHRGIAAGYLTQIAQKKEKRLYQGTRNRELLVFPGSDQSKSSHDWIVAVELIRTSRLFARRTAMIKPEWLEDIAGDLVRKSWSEPRWDPERQTVVASEKVALFGLTIVGGRMVNYGPVNREEANNIFIREALVGGKLNCQMAFWRHNRKLIREIEDRENKTRKRDLLVNDYVMEEFYKQKISGATCLNDLKKIVKKHGGDKFLFMSEQDLLKREPNSDEILFPNRLKVGGRSCSLSYRFQPDRPGDGVTIRLPRSMADSLDPAPFEYLVPGLLKDKIFHLLKNLPKAPRRKLIPLAEKSERLFDEMTSLKYSSDPSMNKDAGSRDFYSELSDFLFRLTRVHVPPKEWDKTSLPDYLRFNFSIKDPETGEIRQSRDLADLTSGEAGPNKRAARSDTWRKLIKPWVRQGVNDWDFEDLLEKVCLTKNSDIEIWGFRALSLEKTRLTLTIEKKPEDAEKKTLKATAFLLEQKLGSDLNGLRRGIYFEPETVSMFEEWDAENQFSLNALQKKFNLVGTKNKAGVKTREKLRNAAFEMIRQGLTGYDGEPVRSRKMFEKRLEKARARIKGLAARAVGWIDDAFKARRRALSAMSRPDLSRDGFPDSVRREMNWFFSENCLNEIPLEQWPHCARLLKAYRRRVEKYSLNPAAQQDRSKTITPYQEKCQGLWKNKNDLGDDRLWALRRFRWMVEELKVSLLSQELKTAFPISPKRLDKFIQKYLSDLK